MLASFSIPSEINASLTKAPLCFPILIKNIVQIDFDVFKINFKSLKILTDCWEWYRPRLAWKQQPQHHSFRGTHQLFLHWSHCRTNIFLWRDYTNELTFRDKIVQYRYSSVSLWRAAISKLKKKKYCETQQTEFEYWITLSYIPVSLLWLLLPLPFERILLHGLLKVRHYGIQCCCLNHRLNSQM
jgi:hypothetical protein